MNLNVLSFVFVCNMFIQSFNMRHIHHRKQQNAFDFIIVGGGTAGSVLAARLSEDRSWKILLVEAGDSNRHSDEVPAMAAKYQRSSLDWNYETQPQGKSCLGLKQQKLFWPAGKVLGGTSEINYMVYTRGNREDYDLWARNGNPGWSYDQVLPYFMKSEKYRFKMFNPKYHSDRGVLNVEHTYTSNLTDIFLDAAQRLGYDIHDYNGKNQTRFSKIKAHLKGGHRHSVFEAFLSPVHRHRKNLVVMCSAYVKKLIINRRNVVKGIVMVQDGQTKKAFAKKQVILSAGVVGTSKILLLSGIGPREHLQDLQIPLVQNLQVGLGVKDHISYFGLNYLTSLPVNFKRFHSCKERCISSSPAGIEAIGFVNLNCSQEHSNTPDVEILMVNHLINRDLKTLTNMKEGVYQKCFQNVEEVVGVNIFPILLHPKSEGYIRLRSKNALEAPIIQPNYLSAREDVKKMVAAVKFVEKLMKTKKFVDVDAALYPVPVCDEFKLYCKKYWKCAVKKLTMSFNDYMGGCKMGPYWDKGAVVNSRLQVYGVENLMVVDASVIPVTISGHVGAATVMVAEKAADMIKERHRNNN